MMMRNPRPATVPLATALKMFNPVPGTDTKTDTAENQG